MSETLDPEFYTTPFQLTKTLHRDPYDALLPTNPKNLQKDKIVIVTGPYGAIGAAIASVWARADAFGVVLAGRKLEKLAEVEQMVKRVATNPNIKVLSVSVDVTSETQVQNLYARIEETFGRPADVLVNSAGSGADVAPLGNVPWDAFTNTFEVNFLGAALMAKYFVKSQSDPSNPVGTIVYITSGVSALTVPGMASLSIAKLAGQRLTEYMHAEYSSLRTFTLSPGIVLTDQTPDFVKPFAKDHIDLPGMMTLYLVQGRADFLRGGWVSVNWDVGEMESHKEEIVEKDLLKLPGMPARFGAGGHPFEERR